MPVIVDLAGETMGPPLQALAMPGLKLPAALPAIADQANGLATKMADDGYDRTPAIPSITNRNVLCGVTPPPVSDDAAAGTS